VGQLALLPDVIGCGGNWPSYQMLYGVGATALFTRCYRVWQKILFRRQSKKEIKTKTPLPKFYKNPAFPIQQFFTICSGYNIGNFYY
jgi:hypothetical protein